MNRKEEPYRLRLGDEGSYILADERWNIFLNLLLLMMPSPVGNSNVRVWMCSFAHGNSLVSRMLLTLGVYFNSRGHKNEEIPSSSCPAAQTTAYWILTWIYKSSLWCTPKSVILVLEQDTLQSQLFWWFTLYSIGYFFSSVNTSLGSGPSAIGLRIRRLLSSLMALKTCVSSFCRDRFLDPLLTLASSMFGSVLLWQRIFWRNNEDFALLFLWYVR